MPKTPPSKKKKAFRLRLQGLTIAEVARQCQISKRTVQKLENGWTDNKGVRRPGWKDDMERIRQDEENAELESAMHLKEERIKAYERLLKQTLKTIEEQFPAIKMKNASDAKALMSEARELGRLISKEKGEDHPSGTQIVAIKADITMNELRESFQDARQVKVIEAKPPEKAQDIDHDSDEEEPDRAGA